MPETPTRGCRTGLLILVPAEEIVGDFRRRHNAVSVARRIPPHITVLFPFVTAAAVDEGTHTDLAAHFAAFDSFAAELTGVGFFDNYVWLAPEPRDRFLDMIAATCTRFPEFPPYAGEGLEPEPHLTIAAIDNGGSAEQVANVARAEFAALLPFRFTVEGVSLFEERDDGTWRESARFGLG
jgi:2'-5' RNA ligase